MIPPVLSALELALGRLYLGPASPGELRAAYERVSRQGVYVHGGWAAVEAVVRSLEVQGLVGLDGEGRLYLARDRLHPAAARMAELAAGDLKRAGVV